MSQDQPEYLEPSTGSAIPSAPSTGRRKRFVLAGAAVAALAVVGAGAWAVNGFLSTGPQPAEALPASTILYSSIDLDPSGSQKVEAYRFLKKFPAIADQLTLDAEDDLRRELFDAFKADAGCDELDFAEDVEPWLGSRAAVAGVDLGEESLVPVVVLQVTDAEAAEQGLKGIQDCAAPDSEGSALGWVVEEDWVVLAESRSQAEAVVADAARGTLADDPEHARWVDEVDEGIVTVYAAPEAGQMVLKQMEPLLAQGAAQADALTGSPTTDDDFMAEFDEACADPMSERCETFMEEWKASELEGTDQTPTSGEPMELPEEMRTALEDFGGAIMTLGFHDSALQLDVAADASVVATSGLGDATGANELAGAAPADAVAVLSFALQDGWAQQWLDQMSDSEVDLEKGIAEAEEALGISIPEDVETLLGDRVAVVVGGSMTADEFMESSGPSDVPVGVVVEGDEAGIETVLGRIRTHATLSEEDRTLLDSSAGDGKVAIGPNADFRDTLLAGGDLADSDTYTSVVASEGDAFVLYLDFNAAGDWLVSLAEQSDQADVVDNVRPLRAFGVTSWRDGDVGRAVLRLSTD